MRRHYRDSQGREMCNVEFDGRGKETFVSKATYVDDGSDVPDYELDTLSNSDCFCFCCRESA